MYRHLQGFRRGRCLVGDIESQRVRVSDPALSDKKTEKLPRYKPLFDATDRFDRLRLFFVPGIPFIPTVSGTGKPDLQESVG